MKKKFLSLALIGSLSLASLVGCSSNNKAENNELKVTLVLDKGGVNDQSFNESAWNGAQELQNVYPDLDISYIESKQDADYITNIETAIDSGSDLVIGVGFNISEALLESAKAYPETDFIMIDSTYEEIPENVQTITFDEIQSGYLVGLIAGKMTKTNIIGFIGGMDIPTCSNFGVGFEKGAKEVNPEVQVLTQFTNSFTDAAKGKAIANQMYKNGADIILAAGGGCNIGIFESAKELNKYAMGVDSPNTHIAPEVIISSALKNVGKGVYNSVEDYIEGEFEGGISKRYNITSGAVGFEDSKLIPQNIKDFVNQKINELK